MLGLLIVKKSGGAKSMLPPEQRRASKQIKRDRNIDMSTIS